MTWAAILIMVMILMVGLSIDMAIGALGVHHEQNAADAASLAGAQIVKVEPPNAVIARALATANRNYVMKLAVELDDALQPLNPNPVDESVLDVIVGRWIRSTRQLFPTLDAPNAVKVIVRRGTGTSEGAQGPIWLVFGQMVGVPDVSLERQAVAYCFDSAGAGLIALADNPVDDKGKPRPGLELEGATLDIQNGGIHVNSTYVDQSENSAAIDIGSSSRLDAGQINVVGDYYVDGNKEIEDVFYDADGNYRPVSVNTGEHFVEPIDDPLQSVRDNPPVLSNDMIPVYPGTTNPIVETIDDAWVLAHGGTLQPGYYPGGIHLTATGTALVLAPGEYYLGGSTDGRSGLVTTGGDLTGIGVRLYVTEDIYHADGQYGKVDLGGSGVINLVSIGDADPTDEIGVDGLDGIAIWQDPLNPGEVEPDPVPEATFNGTGDFNISGTLYFPDPIHVNINGTPGQMGNQIICGSVSVQGNASFLVNYDNRNNLMSYTSMLVK